MRACHPRDLLDQVTALCRYRGIEPVITRELLDAACDVVLRRRATERQPCPQRSAPARPQMEVH